MLENEEPRRIAVRAANLRTGIEPMKSTSFLLCVRESLGPFEGNILLRNCGSGKGFEKIVPRGKVGGPVGEKGAVCWKHPIPFLFCGR